MKRFGLADIAAALAFITITVVASWQMYHAEIRDRQELSRRVHGCNLLAEVMRNRADTLFVIKTCAEWNVPQPFSVPAKR